MGNWGVGDKGERRGRKVVEQVKELSATQKGVKRIAGSVRDDENGG